MTNWEILFGTPERTIRTLMAIGNKYPCDESNEDYVSMCDNCPLGMAPSCRLNRYEPEKSQLLGWLESEACDA